ncbi:hypothetical protein Xen7305DRAFT_00003570 [Xenococcus sp. PCC 7305]|nr:hypothetical protein Xen7305DRAFT_00003570 [Xenococcus sp. PCC 7305]
MGRVPSGYPLLPSLLIKLLKDERFIGLCNHCYHFLLICQAVKNIFGFKDNDPQCYTRESDVNWAFYTLKSQNTVVKDGRKEYRN